MEYWETFDPWGDPEPSKMGRCQSSEAEIVFFTALVGKRFGLALECFGETKIVVPGLVASLGSPKGDTGLSGRTTFHFKLSSFAKESPRDWRRVCASDDYLLPITSREIRAANEIARRDRAARAFKIRRGSNASPNARKIRDEMGASAPGGTPGVDGGVNLFPPRSEVAAARRLGAKPCGKGIFRLPAERVATLSAAERIMLAKLSNGAARRTFVDHKSGAQRAPFRAAGYCLYILRYGMVDRRDEIETDSAGPLVVSNVGTTPMDFSRFFQAAEVLERAGGRTAHVLVASLPHDLPPEVCREILEEFVRQFEDLGLGFLVVVHRGPRGGRNRHVHLMFYDRPMVRGQDGVWQSAGPKPPAIHHRDWPQKARNLWAELCRRKQLEVIDREGGDASEVRLFDPRSYRDMGIDTTPTRHLGPAAAELERQGIPTSAGVENALLRLNDAARRIADERSAGHEQVDAEVDRIYGIDTPVAESQQEVWGELLAAREALREAGKRVVDAQAHKRAIEVGVRSGVEGLCRRLTVLQVHSRRSHARRRQIAGQIHRLRRQVRDLDDAGALHEAAEALRAARQAEIRARRRLFDVVAVYTTQKEGAVPEPEVRAVEDAPAEQKKCKPSNTKTLSRDDHWQLRMCRERARSFAKTLEPDLTVIDEAIRERRAKLPTATPDERLQHEQDIQHLEMRAGRVRNELARIEMPFRTYLDVPKGEGKRAKALGATWDFGRRLFYVPVGAADPIKFDLVNEFPRFEPPRYDITLDIFVPPGRMEAAENMGVRFDRFRQNYYLAPTEPPSKARIIESEFPARPKRALSPEQEKELAEFRERVARAYVERYGRTVFNKTELRTPPRSVAHAPVGTESNMPVPEPRNEPLPLSEAEPVVKAKVPEKAAPRAQPKSRKRFQDVER